MSNETKTLGNERDLKIEYVSISELTSPEYNPRFWSEENKEELKQSIIRYGVVDPLLVNSAEERKGIVIGGNFRLSVLKELGHETVPVVYISIPELEKEKGLCLRLNKNQGEWSMELLAQFDETFLSDLGFDSVELDKIFEDETTETVFDLEKELKKAGVDSVTVQKGDIYDLDGSRLMCGDSTIEADMLKLCGEKKIDMVMTDPPYILDYLNGKGKHGDAVTGFGAKKNRRYLETEVLPPDFTEKWMANVSKVQAEHFAIIVYENWKNIRTIWGEMDKHWKVRNMIVWHLPNRNQGYSGKHKFFSKHDIAMVGTSSEGIECVIEDEGLLIENEYETALFAIKGKPHWESYGKGKKYCPTDFIDFNAADEKSSGQGVIFGTKPIEILIPYIKVLTKRGQLVLEPFGGSGSTLIAATKLERQCFIMEKVPSYAEVIMSRWERLTGKKRVKVNHE